MYIILAILIIAFIYITLLSYFEDNSVILSMAIGLGTALVTAFFAFVVLVLISTIYIQSHTSDFVYSKTLISTKYIKTLQDNISMDGSFVLGFGSINSESNFYYYAMSNDSTSVLDHASTDICQIIETNYSKPRIETYQYKIDWSKSHISKWLFNVTDGEYNTNYIYVPKGTIMIKYNLDAK